MKIIVDWDSCEGNGLCMGEAPDVFDVDDDDQMHLLLEHPPAELHDAVRRAVRVCPKAALGLEENDPGSEPTPAN